MDSQQALIEKSLLQAARTVEQQLDSQLKKLDNLEEGDLEAIRRKRLEELKRNEVRKDDWLSRGHGKLADAQEKDFFKEMKGEERLVCLFYRESPPCQVMIKHLGILAASHIETKFLMIEAEKAPFLAERLKIWMLPTIALVKNEKTTDYIVGLDDMGGIEDFDTAVLESRLIESGILFERNVAKPNLVSKGAMDTTAPIRKGLRRTESDEDSDFD